MIYIIISILIGLTSIGISIYIRYKKETTLTNKLLYKQYQNNKNRIEKDFKKRIEDSKKLYLTILNKEEENIEFLKTNIKLAKTNYENEFTKIDTEYNKKINDLKKEKEKAEFEFKLAEEKKQHINETLSNYYLSEKERIDNKLVDVLKSAIFEMNSTLTTETANYNTEINSLKKELESYQAKQRTINEAIMREKRVQEQSEFYKINLSSQEIADLLMLQELAPRFNNRELLNKVIYESYIKRPLSEMIKRVLNGRSPCGIYKITRLKTGEIYIGRAVSVDKRWTEHAKMAFSIGSIAHSTLHTLMEKDGIWNFTFELLEEVSREHLNEREKYYIDFYDSKNFGMNQKAGG